MDNIDMDENAKHPKFIQRVEYFEILVELSY